MPDVDTRGGLQADDRAHAMHAAAHARAHRASAGATVDPAAAVDPTEAQRRVLECASLSYAHPEVAVPAALRGLQRLPLDADRRAEQLQAVWGGLPPYKELVQKLTGDAPPQGAELRGENAARIAAQRLTAHFSLLEDEFRRALSLLLFSGLVVFCASGCLYMAREHPLGVTRATQSELF